MYIIIKFFYNILKIYHIFINFWNFFIEDIVYILNRIFNKLNIYNIIFYEIVNEVLSNISNFRVLNCFFLYTFLNCFFVKNSTIVFEKTFLSNMKTTIFERFTIYLINERSSQEMFISTNYKFITLINSNHLMIQSTFQKC